MQSMSQDGIGLVGQVVAFTIDEESWSSIVAPNCWIELITFNIDDSDRQECTGHVHSKGKSQGQIADGVLKPNQKILQQRHNQDTIYRASAVLQETNTLGPVPFGLYQLRLTECYGGFDGVNLALVSIILYKRRFSA